MKKLLCIIFIIIANQAAAQTYALLDRRWYKDAIFTDTITKADLTDGWFPIYTSELDSLYTLINKFKNIRSDGVNRKFYYANDFKTEFCTFQIENIKRAYGDGYEINVVSNTPIGANTLKIADPDKKLTGNQDYIRALISYLNVTRKNLSDPKKRKKNYRTPLTG